MTRNRIERPGPPHSRVTTTPRVVTAPAAVLLAMAAPLAPSQDRLPAPFPLEVTRLELTLDLDYDEGSLEGFAVYRIVNRSDGPVSEVPFNVGRLLTVRGAHVDGGPMLPVDQDVRAFVDEPRRQVNHVVVALPEPLAPGATISMRLDYGGFVVGYAETGSLYVQDRVSWSAVARYQQHGAFSMLRSDALAWPVPGSLDGSVNRSAPLPAFTFRVTITVPEPHVVASGGRLVRRETVGGRTTFVYESVGPVPFLNVPVAPYAVVERSGVHMFHFPQDSLGAERVLERSGAALTLLERWFGPLASIPEVVIMEIPSGWGSQASLTGGIIQTADAFRDGASMTPVYHELSHLWNATDLDQPSARWNEGLATFLQLRMAEALDGARLHERVLQVADAVREGAADAATVPFARYGEAGRTDLSYRVGCLMFYALYAELGAVPFDTVLRDFFQSHQTRGWTFEGLVGAVQAESPTDLTGFFETWVYTTDWYDALRAGTPLEDIGLRP